VEDDLLKAFEIQFSNHFMIIRSCHMMSTELLQKVLYVSHPNQPLIT